jgi:FdhD protein
VDEIPFWIAVNGRRRLVLSCAAGDGRALAIGHLLGEGWIRGIDDVLDLVLRDGPGGACGAEVTIPDDRAAAAEHLVRHQTEHGCGQRHFLDCDADPPRVVPAAAPADLTAAFRSLFAIADAAAPQGGVHAAALSDGHALRHQATDVARHCAVDRALGAGAINGAVGHDRASADGVVLTARITAAMVLKVARAGLPWLASRSIATPLARALAAATGVHLIEQAVRRDRRPRDPVP